MMYKKCFGGVYNMKLLYKFFIIITLICFIKIIFYYCPIGNGINDYTFKLAGGYELWKVNSYDYKIVHINNDLNWEENIVSNVLEVSYSDNFIYVKSGCFNLDGTNNIISANIQSYYIIDVKSKTVLGPYISEDEFHQYISEKNIDEKFDWIKVNEIKASLEQRQGIPTTIS